MKIWQLIEKLKDFDEDLDVLTVDQSDGSLNEIEGFDVRICTWWKSEGYVTDEGLVLF